MLIASYVDVAHHVDVYIDVDIRLNDANSERFGRTTLRSSKGSQDAVQLLRKLGRDLLSVRYVLVA